MLRHFHDQPAVKLEKLIPKASEYFFRQESKHFLCLPLKWSILNITLLWMELLMKQLHSEINHLQWKLFHCFCHVYAFIPMLNQDMIHLLLARKHFLLLLLLNNIALKHNSDILVMKAYQSLKWYMTKLSSIKFHFHFDEYKNEFCW